jgi:hypothetical protein
MTEFERMISRMTLEQFAEDYSELYYKECHSCPAAEFCKSQDSRICVDVWTRFLRRLDINEIRNIIPFKS